VLKTKDRLDDTIVLIVGLYISLITATEMLGLPVRKLDKAAF
jgi:hypothetical protein